MKISKEKLTKIVKESLEEAFGLSWRDQETEDGEESSEDIIKQLQSRVQDLELEMQELKIHIQQIEWKLP